DKDCFAKLITVFGRRALRRPLSAPEVQRYVGDTTKGLWRFAQEDKNFYTAVELAIRMFLQHPELLYHIEADKSRPVAGHAGPYQLSPSELAPRLSFLIWGDGPDDGLLDQAKAGRLESPQAIRATALKMLADPRARKTVAAFHAMWLNYETLDGVTASLTTP